VTSPLTFEHPQRIGPGVDLPAKMAVLPLAPGELALVSPVPIDAELAARIDVLGRVRFLVAPNLYHHLYLADAVARYPEAALLAPPGLEAKRPELRVSATLDGPLPAAFTDHVEVVRLEGAPSIGEHLLFHRASRTLVVTDLVFHVRTPKGLAARLVLTLMGTRGRLAASRMWSFATKDRDAMRESLARVLALPFTRVIVAHGEDLDVDAKPRLEAALRERFGALPSDEA
jgi:hypothetical protein